MPKGIQPTYFCEPLMICQRAACGSRTTVCQPLHYIKECTGCDCLCGQFYQHNEPVRLVMCRHSDSPRQLVSQVRRQKARQHQQSFFSLQAVCLLSLSSLHSPFSILLLLLPAPSFSRALKKQVFEKSTEDRLQLQGYKSQWITSILEWGMEWWPHLSGNVLSTAPYWCGINAAVFQPVCLCPGVFSQIKICWVWAAEHTQWKVTLSFGRQCLDPVPEETNTY